MFLLKKHIPEVQYNDSCENHVSFRVALNNKAVMKMECRVEGERIHINDIEPIGGKRNARKYFNKGYGSQLMNALLEYAEQKSITEIYGELSIVDLGHKERLHHFYRKFGFEITTFSAVGFDGFYGSISKKL